MPQLKKCERDIQMLTMEKAAVVDFVANSEEQCDWISDENAYILLLYSVEKKNIVGCVVGCL